MKKIYEKPTIKAIVLEALSTTINHSSEENNVEIQVIVDGEGDDRA